MLLSFAPGCGVNPGCGGGGGTGRCSGGVTGSPAPSPLWVIRLQQPVPMPTRGPEENHGPTLAHHPSGPSNSPLRAALSRQGDPAAARGPMRMRPSSRAWQGPLSSSDSTSSLSGSLPHLTRGQQPGGCPVSPDHPRPQPCAPWTCSRAGGRGAMPPLRLGTPGSPPCPHFHPQWGLRPEPDCLRSQGHGTILAGGEGTVTAAQGRLSLPRGGGAPPVMPTQAPPVGILSGWEQACWWKVLGEQPLPAPSSGRVPPAKPSPPRNGRAAPHPLAALPPSCSGRALSPGACAKLRISSGPEAHSCTHTCAR